MFTHKKATQKQLKTEHGNVLFIILIAVALFAALSYAFTQSSRGGGEDTNPERNSILASEVLEYAKQLEQAVTTIRSNRYSENQLSFAHGDLTGYGTYGTNPEMEIFHPQGGGASYRIFPSATASDWVFTGANIVHEVGNFSETYAACTASCADLVAILPNVSQNLCTTINQKLAINSTPVDSGTADITTKFTGTFTKTQALDDAGSVIDGQRTGCFEGGGTPAAGTYHFYHVLLVR